MELHEQYLNLVCELASARRNVPVKIADDYYNQLEQRFQSQKELVKRPKLPELIIDKEVSLPSKKERLKHFQEAEELLSKYSRIQEASALQRKLELNETHAVLFEKVPQEADTSDVSCEDNREEFSMPLIVTENSRRSDGLATPTSNYLSISLPTPRFNVDEDDRIDRRILDMEIDYTLHTSSEIPKQYAGKAKEAMLGFTGKCLPRTPEKSILDRELRSAARKSPYHHHSMLFSTPVDVKGKCTPIRQRRSGRRSIAND